MCDHNTSVVIYSGLETEVELCEWGCDKILIYKRMPNGNIVLVREVDNPLRARVEELEALIIEADSMSNVGREKRSIEEAELALVTMASLGAEALDSENRKA